MGYQMKSEPDYFSRKIDYAYYRRANSISMHDAPHQLDNVVMTLHRTLDDWRFSDGSPKDVAMCVDALSALWSSVEDRL